MSDLAQRHRVPRAVVQSALGFHPEPAPLRSHQRRPRLLDPVHDLIDRMLRQEYADDGVRLSNRKILQRLADEAGFEAASLSTLRNYVCKRRPQIQAELTTDLQRADDHDPGR
ncbi:hypothetical protein AB0M68_27960 [Streptomyces sp. NPDC051453]|uniref:hypothetical protein n=1 Tax=Streptomyces sp. NPDC051453 TaxID=3154941 RepID=UPI00344A3E7C